MIKWVSTTSWFSLGVCTQFHRREESGITTSLQKYTNSELCMIECSWINSLLKMLWSTNYISLDQDMGNKDSILESCHPWEVTGVKNQPEINMESWTLCSCSVKLNCLFSKRIRTGLSHSDQDQCERLRSHQRLQMFSSKLMVKTLMLPRRWSKFLFLFWDTLCPLLQSFCLCPQYRSFYRWTANFPHLVKFLFCLS